MLRLNRVAGHIVPSVAASSVVGCTTAGSSRNGSDDHVAIDASWSHQGEPLRWNGWGFDDTEFKLNSRGQIELGGSRYLFSGKELPSLRKWMEENAGLDISKTSAPQRHPVVAGARRNEAFTNAIKGHYARVADSDKERLFHAHGHTCQEVYALRFGEFARIPDLVVWPGSHEHVEAIVKAAVEHDVVIIPFGGGTSVTQAVVCPDDEKRMIVSLDMHAMCNIKWINRQSMLACVEAGMVGKELEKKLAPSGLTVGHEPDSAEFSTLGGWVATRASGMRKNRYGNIEDIVVKIKFVTAKGTMEKSVQVPRVSFGPDIHQIIMGSEGILGVVTEVVLRLRPRSEVTRYGSMIFPNFEAGVACMHDVAMQRLQPVSIRLVDNLQFQFGQALKPATDGWVHKAGDKAKKWYVTQHLKFDPNVMVAATLLFEGTKTEVDAHEKKIYTIAAKYGGMKAGPENGIRGYFLTYMIAYLRDFGFNFQFIAESFETSVPFDQLHAVCANTKERIITSAKSKGVKVKPFVSCRVTQTYDTGACIYFYFGIVWEGLKDPVATFSEIEHDARDEILKHGGSLSHHHGVGKLRKSWMAESVSAPGMTAIKALKSSLDPTNVFAAGNLV